MKKGSLSYLFMQSNAPYQYLSIAFIETSHSCLKKETRENEPEL
jgi:hypothetical protein